MSKRSRTKGKSGELEVRAVLSACGIGVTVSRSVAMKDARRVLAEIGGEDV